MKTEMGGSMGAFRDLVGLQFFGGEEAPTEDASGADEFENGLMEDEGQAESAEEAAPQAEETAPQTEGSAEETQGATDAEGSEGENGEEARNDGQTEGRQAQTLPLELGGKTIGLDAGAVRALAQSLGVSAQDAVSVLQKGMRYEEKNSREMSLLTDYARESGMELSQYVEHLEQQKNEVMLQKEMQRAGEELPEGTPEEAVRKIAEANLERQRAQAARETQRAQQEAAQIADTKRVDDWKALLAEHPELSDPQKVPKELFETVAGKHCSPSEAFARIEAARTARELEETKAALAAAQKNNQNKKTAPGSMGSAGNVESDPFLAGLLG